MSSHRFVGAALIAAALLIPNLASAQAQPPAPAAAAPHAGHHRHGGGWHRALKGITLSAAQKTQLKDLMAQQRQQRQQMQGQTVDPATRKANRDKALGQIEAILTPAQRTQFEQNLAKARTERREDQPAMPGATPAP